MSNKESHRVREFFHRILSPKQVISQKREDGNRQDGQVAPPVSFITDAETSQNAKTKPFSLTKELQSRHTASSPYLPAASVQKPAMIPFTDSSASTQKEPAIPTAPSQLWDQAYDDLKRDECKLVELYETIISAELDSSKGGEGNIIEQTDRMKMDRLFETGLDKTAKLTKVGKVEKNIGDAINIVLSVKDAIGGALQAVPIAAVAWAGLFLNPITESATNRDGIIKVIRNMKWYSSLSKLLLEETFKHDKHLADTRGELENLILDLYKALLKYIIKSICAHNRNAALRILINSVKLDGWTGSLDDVNEAERVVKAAARSYGVRETNSYLGLLISMHVSEAQNEIMHKLCITDMAAEIKSLQERKDHLLADSYKWILDNGDYKDFTDWSHSNTKRLLWIKGDPGKGKTMLLIGIVGELTAQLETHFDNAYLSYFFCKGTDDRLNTATAILRGLIWMLLRHQRSLIRHLDIFKDLGSTLFEDHTSFYNLEEIFKSMLKDEALERTYLVIDALDECKREEPGLSQLLRLISEISEENDKVKWLVSSRNEPEIEAILEESTTRTRLSLELNAQSVGSAVKVYIDYKLSELAKRYQKDYATSKTPNIKEELQGVLDKVAEELHIKAKGTFLWVALVFKQIERCEADELLDRVRDMPVGLNSMYRQMMLQVDKRNDAANCKKVLLTMVNTYRPIHLSELLTLAALPRLAIPQKIIKRCGLLSITEDDDIVYFVHQSAKDYLIKNTDSYILSKIFPHGQAEGHRTIFSQSLQAMSTTLQRNVYNLQHPGISITEVKAPNPDPLFSIRYACIYWIDHLCEITSGHDKVGLCDNGIIDVFLRKHFLHWLEALSLLESISHGVLAIAKLIRSLTNVSSESQLFRLVQDAHRFILSNRGIVENAPLQAYTSALIFSPVHSLTRELFNDQEPDWITTKPIVEANWGDCLQTLEGHSSEVQSVAFSHDGRQVASASVDQTVKIWNTSSGDCLQTLEGHSDWVQSVAFSHDGKQVASASVDGKVKIWNTSSGDCLQTLKGHSRGVTSVAFSHDSKQVASALDDGKVKIWNTSSGDCLQTLKGHSCGVRSVAFSHDGKQVASASFDQTVKIWNTSSGDCLQTLEGHSNWVQSVAFSHDGKKVASASDDGKVKIWNTSSGDCLQTLEGHSRGVRSVAFSHDSKQVASASVDRTVKIWNTSSGDCLKTLRVGYLASNISFNTAGSCLLTHKGTISLDTSSASNIALATTVLEEPQHYSYGLSAEEPWITWNDRKVLWLPTEYRPSCSVIAPWIIVIGCFSGQILIIKFTPDKFPLSYHRSF